MTTERDPRRAAKGPDESGPVADIGAISATDLAFDRIADGEPPAGDDPALRLLTGLAGDVRAVPPPPAWQPVAGDPEEEEAGAHPGRARRVGRRTAMTGVGAVAVSVLCAVGVAAATGVDPVASVTDGRLRLTPHAATATPPAGHDGERNARSAHGRPAPGDLTPPRSGTAGTSGGPAHASPPGKAKGWANGKANGHENGNGPGQDNGKHKGWANGKANGNGKAKGHEKKANAADSQPGAGTTKAQPNPQSSNRGASGKKKAPAGEPPREHHRDRSGHSRPNPPNHGHDHGHDQRK